MNKTHKQTMKSFIKVLENPKTDLYYQFKELVCSGKFPWYWDDPTSLDIQKGRINIPFYHHAFLVRPEANGLYSQPDSNLLPVAANLFSSILEHNKVDFNYFIRLGANCVHPLSFKEPVKTNKHLDHQYPHTNILIYFSGSDGDTYVEEKRHPFKTDEIILFRGYHYHLTPLKERRIVGVGTFV